jgi:hypothetical protein
MKGGNHCGEREVHQLQAPAGQENGPGSALDTHLANEVREARVRLGGATAGGAITVWESDRETPEDARGRGFRMGTGLLRQGGRHVDADGRCARGPSGGGCARDDDANKASQ